MAKVDVFSISGEKLSQIDLPQQFSEPVREDLIRRAVLAIHSHNRQPYGADPLAGTRQGYAVPKRRKSFKTTYGKGLSRVARKHLWHKGSQFGWVGAFATNTVKGRKAFPPKVEKIVAEKINKKERRKAIRSAIAATAHREIVAKRNHQIHDVKELPMVVEESFEIQMKTKDIRAILEKFGLKKELERVGEKKVRPGKGKMRGRRFKIKKGPLIVVSKNCDAIRASKNILGLDAVEVKKLNAEMLAPGAQAGRLVIWTKPALEMLAKERLFQ